jgi:hypothetical protein
MLLQLRSFTGIVLAAEGSVLLPTANNLLSPMVNAMCRFAFSIRQDITMGGYLPIHPVRVALSPFMKSLSWQRLFWT